MKLSQILPNFRKFERSCFIGLTGSGKTTLAEYVMSGYKHSVVLDTKHDLEWQGYEICDDIGDLIRNSRKYKRMLYRPERGFERDANYELQTILYEWIWSERNRALYVDEAGQISTSTRICPSLLDLITRGRSRGISVLAGTQRPSGIKQEFLSEARNIYCFQMNLPADKQKVFEYGNINADLITQKNEEKDSDHYFIYSKQGKVTKPLILTI